MATGFEKEQQLAGTGLQKQQQLNQDIQSKQNLLKIADPNSPAQEKLQSELDKLNSDLDINLQELDMLVNQ